MCHVCVVAAQTGWLPCFRPLGFCEVCIRKTGTEALIPTLKLPKPDMSHLISETTPPPPPKSELSPGGRRHNYHPALFLGSVDIPFPFL